MMKVVEGSYAIADAVRCCSPDVISVYPITPQTHIVEHLSEFVAGGKLDCEYINVESEFSSLSSLIGASAAGARSPGSTEITKTGAWRTFVPVFDHGKCIKCSLCEIYCPESCIHQIDGNYVPDLDYCKGCSVCAHECPRGAITMVLEEK